MQRPVDDVFRYDDVTYFFSGTGYQVFDDDEFEVSPTCFLHVLLCYVQYVLQAPWPTFHNSMSSLVTA